MPDVYNLLCRRNGLLIWMLAGTLLIQCHGIVHDSPKDLVSVSLTGDKDLKLYLDKEVDCVTFTIDNGELGLDLELNNGEDEWKPVTVLKPCSNDLGLVAEKLSMVELSDFNDIVFRSRMRSTTHQELS